MRKREREREADVSSTGFAKAATEPDGEQTSANGLWLYSCLFGSASILGSRLN